VEIETDEQQKVLVMVFAKLLKVLADELLFIYASDSRKVIWGIQ